MNDNNEKLIKKVSVKTSIIIIILFIISSISYIANYRFEFKLNSVINSMDTISKCQNIDNRDLINKIDNMKNVTCPICELQPVNIIQKSQNNDAMKFLQIIYLARDRVYLGEDFYNIIADYKEINDNDKIKSLIDEISNYANLNLSTLKSLELLEKFNSSNIEHNNESLDYLNKITSYTNSLIRIKKLDIENNDIDILMHVKNNLINREPEVALKSLSNLNRKDNNLEILRQHLKDTLSLTNIFNELIHYVISKDFNKN